MKIIFHKNGWEDYLYWQDNDKKIIKRLNLLIRESMRTPFDGIGKPEPLKGSLSGWWSRRITRKHRLVYRIEDKTILIAQCRYHY